MAMWEQLQQLLQGQEYDCHLVKIDGNIELEQRYGARVPVLVAGNRELCQGKLNHSAVSNFLNPAHP